MKENYLLKTDGAARLYREVARDLPIIDYHNHLSVGELAEDRRYENLYELWLRSDPYKHRLMRIAGVEQERMGFPSASTVQSPQLEVSQPRLTL